MNQTSHLTDEQMYELLGQSADAQAQAHLRSCTECQSEFAGLNASFGNLRSATTNLAALYAPRTLEPRVASKAFSRRVWAASFATAAAALAISISLLYPMHSSSGTAPAAVAAIPQTAQPAESDDALLNGIQQDLSSSIPSSLEPLATSAPSSSDTSAQD